MRKGPLGAANVGMGGVVGGGLSAVGMGVACASYEEGDCGAVFPGVLATWALWTGLWAAVAGSPYESFQRERFATALRGYARFPQGLPEPLDEQLFPLAPPEGPARS